MTCVHIFSRRIVVLVAPLLYFWTARGHKTRVCSSRLPRVNTSRASGSALLRLANFLRSLLTPATLALSAPEDRKNKNRHPYEFFQGCYPRNFLQLERYDGVTNPPQGGSVAAAVIPAVSGRDGA